MKVSQARHAFITGGGIGLGIVDALVRRKVAVTIADINGDNRSYIYTHPERFAASERRFAGIMSGFDAA